jgi:hypothetical protein
VERNKIIAEKIALVQDWALEHEFFDTTFVDSLAEQIKKGRDLTDKQVQALMNIIDQWNMEDEDSDD